ncbi:MAG: SpoIIE family protein phosphatase [Thermoleophilia bacterium]|nr:SpoIIE family protein phosphatase [Thermoleophilia bacterium]
MSEVLLSPQGRFQRNRWLVLAVAVILQVLLVLAMYFTDSTVHPLAPLGAGVVFISVLAAGLSGVLVGLLVVLAGVVASFLLLADFSTVAAAANAIVSAVAWCAAALVTGLVVSHLRSQLSRREAALEQSLSHSLAAKRQLERILEFTPNFHEGETPAEVAQAICETAVETFGSDGARLYAIKDDMLEILALTKPTGKIVPGLTIPITQFPNVEQMFAKHRPDYARDVRAMDVKEKALKILDDLRIASVIRLPIFSPKEPSGVLTLGWTHPIERPSDELLAIMQRFADQAGMAWQNALRLEAQRRADRLYETLERVVALAPTFHITGTREEVAEAICEAAVMTFECERASLYRVEGDRMTLLDCVPPLKPLSPGRTFPLSDDMPLVREMRHRKPTFIPDLSDPTRSARPWTADVMAAIETRSALYVPLRFDERGPQNLLVLNWDESRQPPDETFLVVVERFADQVALALSNASAERLHARLEASLLPTAPVEHPFAYVLTRYQTGEQRLRLGGDFVGSTVVGDHDLRFIIGDVSGHGPDAAALGATLRSTWKALALAGVSTSETVGVMRKMLLAERRQSGIFATIVAGRIDFRGQTISLVNAGHQPPLLIARQVISLDTRPVLPLGVGVGDAPMETEFPLPKRWSLFCYTDGLTDIRLAPGSSQRYGEDRLRERLAPWTKRRPGGPELDSLMKEIETASGGRFADDVAILLISTKDEDAAQPVC